MEDSISHIDVGGRGSRVARRCPGQAGSRPDVGEKWLVSSVVVDGENPVDQAELRRILGSLIARRLWADHAGERVGE